MMATASVKYDYLFKILIVGDSGVGKTAVMRRFANDVFDGSSPITIGVDFKIRTIELDNKVLKLQIWDTNAQERFRALTSSYYRGAHGVIITYDVTDRQSFDNLQWWLDHCDRFADPRGVSKLLIGNKTDLNARRVVSSQEGKGFADEFGIGFIETSAKSSSNVEKAFYAIAAEIKSRMAGDVLEGKTEKKSFRVGTTTPLTSQRPCCF